MQTEKTESSFLLLLLTQHQQVKVKQQLQFTLNELYDGNPPFKGHGGMSYAPSVASVIEVCNTLEKFTV